LAVKFSDRWFFQPKHGLGFLFDEFHKAEIQNFHIAVGTNHYVFRFDVPVNQVRSVRG